MSTSMQKIRKPILLDPYSPSRQEEDMRAWLSERLIGQPEAIEAAVRMITMALSKLKDSGKAAGLYYFLGEPGVGKTELVKLVVEYLHGHRNAYVKIDGASLHDKYTANRLIGAPPGYVGFEDPKDTEAREAREAAEDEKDPEKAARKFRKNPRKLLCRKNLVASRRGSSRNISVVFVDEADKMYHTIDDLFLNASEDGVMPLGDNEEVDFSDVLIIYSGNPGSKEAVNRKERIGFVGETVDQKNEATRDIIMGALRERYRPEMLDRFEEFVFFKKLTKDELRGITSLRVNEVKTRFMETMGRGSAFTIEVQDDAIEYMLDQALKNTGNARRIGRAVRKYFTSALNRLISLIEDANNGIQIISGDLVKVSYDAAYRDGKLLKFELFEDAGVVAPQDTIAPSKKDTPLGLKYAGFDRQITAAAEEAKTEVRNLYSVTIALESEKDALEEWVTAKKEAPSILRMELVEARVAMKAPWSLTLVYQITSKQSQLLKMHYPLATVAYVGKGPQPEPSTTDSKSGTGEGKRK
ncbi:MAG: ATP-dependent Clp protease ATP-binding subunit [Cyanobacteria bacterium SZAS LIN-3]|nr:ATP-dependent Clp protease ATP-binding subunit [Cyanobacteria bacterium SZAS LIN-3]